MMHTDNPQQASNTHTTSTIQLTADFSEAEESTDSNDNDDRLSWQAVSGRGKKRKCPRTTKVLTMKKNKQQETITNKFEALLQVEEPGKPLEEPAHIDRSAYSQNLRKRYAQEIMPDP
jgi:hypothetical protein